MSDESRYELTMAAAARARANRPSALVAGAVVLLVVALGAMVWGLVSRAGAISDLREAQSEQARVEALAGEWTALADAERTQAGGKAGLGARISDLYTRMEQYATRAGMTKRPDTPRENPTTRPNTNIRVIEYYYTNVKDPSLKALLEWVRIATAEVPGLEVYGITLKPDPNNWTMNVTFRRWERAS